MPVFRVHHQSEYTVISNAVIRDMNLSLKTLGLFVKMLSLPNNWDFSIAGLAAISKEGETAVNGALRELEEFKYLTRKRIYQNGKVVDIQYDLYECPSLNEKKLNVENLEVENLNLENPDNKINNKLNKEDNKIKKDKSKKVKYIPDEDNTLNESDFFNKFQDSKDPRVLIHWTDLTIENNETKSKLIDWIKTVLNNKYMMLKTYDSNLQKLFTKSKEKNLSVGDVVEQCTTNNWINFDWVLDKNNNFKSKPSFQYEKRKENNNELFGIDRKIDVSIDEVF